LEAVKQNQEVYLYGIIPAQIGLVSDCEGVANLKVYAVPVGGVAILTSYLDIEEPDLNIEDAVKHVKVLETAMKQSAVIPIKFGTVVESFEEFKKLMIAKSDLLKKELQRLHGKYEVGVKAYWKKEAVLIELKHRFKDHASLIARAQLDPQAALELGQRVEAVVNEFREKMENTIHSYFSTAAADNTTGEMMSAEMLYNGSFLVNAAQDEELKKRVEKTAQKYSEMIEFHYTTWLPPYNFVKNNLAWRGKK
jgi:Gas vesicle synthesis protein GvpL/GvpF